MHIFLYAITVFLTNAKKNATNNSKQLQYYANNVAPDKATPDVLADHTTTNKMSAIRLPGVAPVKDFDWLLSASY